MKLLTTTKQITSMHFFFLQVFWGSSYFCITHVFGVFEAAYIVTWSLFKSGFTNHTVEPNPLDCVQLSLVAELSQTQSYGVSSIGSEIKLTKFSVQFCSIAELNQMKSTDCVWLCLIKFDFQTFDWLCWDSAQDVFFSPVRNFPRLKKAACTRDVLHRSNN